MNILIQTEHSLLGLHNYEHVVQKIIFRMAAPANPIVELKLFVNA